MLNYKFDLKEYIKTSKVFSFYDALMEIQNIKKYELFKAIDVAKSSYHHARKKEDNAGEEIIIKLEKYFNYKPLSIDKISEYENTLSNLYQDIYYRNISKMSEYMEKINEYINDNNILNVIFKVFKILIDFMDHNYTPLQNKQRCKELFNQLEEYYDFFNEEIKCVYKITEILISDGEIDVNEIVLLTDNIPYFKSMSYFALTSKFSILKDYKSVVLYGKICEEKLVKDYNYQRLWTLQLNVIASYNALGNYKFAYKMSIRKLSSLKSFDIYSGNYLSSLDHYYVSCLGLYKYEEIFEVILNKDVKDSFEYLILMFIEYQKKRQENIDFYYEKLIKNLRNNDPYYKISKSVYEIFKGINVITNFQNIEEGFNYGYVELLKKNVRQKK